MHKDDNLLIQLMFFTSLLDKFQFLHHLSPINQQHTTATCLIQNSSMEYAMRCQCFLRQCLPRSTA